ncbi:MAG: amino acid carrier protein [Gammaproteobacteria bacterium]|nr:MAG: amino acid carrier protein [Gammaproteobacteria bacterium]
MTELITSINDIVWGPAMLVLILGTGIYLSIGLRFISLRRIGYGFKLLWQGRAPHGEGDISTFGALMTALSATIGTGNIADDGATLPEAKPVVIQHRDQAVGVECLVLGLEVLTGGWPIL